MQEKKLNIGFTMYADIIPYEDSLANLAGYVDYITREHVVGWAMSKQPTRASIRIVASLDGYDIAGGYTGIDRPDLASFAIDQNDCGFSIPFDASAITPLVFGSDDLNDILDLSIILCADAGNGQFCAKLRLPDTFVNSRTRSEWREFFFSSSSVTINNAPPLSTKIIEQIHHNTSFADTLPFCNLNAKFAGYVDLVDSTGITGWAFRKGVLPTDVRIIVHLGGKVVGKGVADRSRDDIAVFDPTKVQSGFFVAFALPLVLRILAEKLALEGDSPVELLVEVAEGDEGNCLRSQLKIADGFHTIRDSSEWLYYFGFTLSQDILVARETIYRNICDIATLNPNSPESRIELYLSSFLHKDVYKFSSPENVNGFPQNLINVLFSEEYFAKALNTTYGLTINKKHILKSFLSMTANPLENPHPLFLMKWYRRRYNIPEAVNPLIDYALGGWACGREPNFLFYTDYINEMANHDSFGEESNISPLERYLTIETYRKCTAHPFFPRWITFEKMIDVFRNKQLSSCANLFDLSAYNNQLKSKLTLFEALEHYLTYGENSGLYPINMFDPGFYRREYEYTSDLVGPFVHFLFEGGRLLRDPSPFFSTRYYIENNNDVVISKVNPLAHYLLRADLEVHRKPNLLYNPAWIKFQNQDCSLSLGDFISDSMIETLSPHPALMVAPRTNLKNLVSILYSRATRERLLPCGVESTFSHFPVAGATLTPERITCGAMTDEIIAFESECACASSEKVRRLKLDEPISRMYENFDEYKAYRYLKSLINDLSTKNSPLVSVIMPVRNRQEVILRAVDSVLGQTYRNLELIVVDDGSIDGTPVLISGVLDDRIRVVTTPPQGVSAARNVGLLEAKGNIIAYLDSDNTWQPNFLEAMIAVFQRDGCTAAHAALKIENPQSKMIRYRGGPYDKEAMDRENYIDMNIFMHDRRYVDSGIRFDENLRRCVDWDFIRRLCLESNGSTYVPIIGCNYQDDDLPNRISPSELVGDFYKLSIRQMNLTPHLSGRQRHAPAYSIIWPVHHDDINVKINIWLAAQHLRFGQHELILINNNLSHDMTVFLNALSGRVDGMRVIHLWRSFMDFPAVDLACRIALGDRLLLWRDTVKYHGSNIDNFMESCLTDSALIQFPLVVDTNEVIADGLFYINGTGSAVQRIMTGQFPDSRISRLVAAANMHFPVSIARDYHADVGGFNTDFALRLGLVEYVIRALRANPNATLVWMSHRFVDVKAPCSFGSQKAIEKEVRWFTSKVAIPCDVSLRVADENMTIPSTRCASISTALDLVRPSVPLPFLPRLCANSSLRIQIMCPAPDNDATLQNWGDFHLANSLRNAFEAVGHTCSIRLQDHWKKPSSRIDVALHIRGICEIVHVPGAFNCVWLISHIDTLRSSEIGIADLIFSPSETARNLLLRQFGTDSVILPQATDARRFFYIEQIPFPSLADRLLFIGNSRRVPRRIVLDAVQMNLPLEVNGSDWEFYINRRYVKSSYVPNERLSKYYRSAMCVLNDHWLSMAESGIISNRLFDVAASGGIAISDPVDGLATLFHDHVRTYNTPQDLADLVASLPDWEPSSRARYDLSREVLEHHSYDVRVRQILHAIKTY